MDVVNLNTVIAIVAAGVGSYVSYFFSIRKAEKDARRDYEYKARIKLYENYQPLVFQFHQLCESAYSRIKDLVKQIRHKRGRRYNEGEYSTYINNSIYRIIAPLAIFKLM